MRRSPLTLPLCLAALALLAAAPGHAQSPFAYGVSAFVGMGGSSDAEPDAGFANLGYQLGFSLAADRHGKLGVRFAHLDLDDEGSFGDLDGAGLQYATVAGEYVFRTTYYTSGIYLGLGGYRLAGRDVLTRRSEAETSIGVALGLTGEYAMNRRWAVLIDISGHWADLDRAQLFAVGHVGVGFRF